MPKTEISFRKQPPERLSCGTLIQQVTYSLGHETHEYLAEGTDLQDLERDWGFKYLELQENIEGVVIGNQIP